MARTVDDVAAIWEVLSGKPADPGGAGELRVVSAPEAALPELEPEVATAYAGALEVLRGISASLQEGDVIPFGSFDAARSVVLMWQALQVHRSRGWWPARSDAYTDETRGYLASAERNLSPEAFESATTECRKLAGRLASALAGADVLVTPTLPCVAPTHAEAAARDEGKPRRPIVMKLTLIPAPVNVAGLAALSLPAGPGAGGLPVGLQLIGRDEATLLKLGSAYEKSSG